VHPEHPEDYQPLTQLVPMPITSATVSSIRNDLEAHESGLFVESSRLADHLLRDADVQQALNQRVLGVMSLPFDIEPADDSAAAVALADDVERFWNRVAPKAALSDIIRSATMLGFAVAQIVWTYDEELAEFIPVLDPWHPAFVEYQAWDNRWFAHHTLGRTEIIPGDGRWLLYTPWSPRRGHMYGAIRCLAEWFLRAQYAGKDASRWSEVHGQGVWLAKLPSMAAESPDGKRFIASIRNLGRAGVVMLPQGDRPETSYDLSLGEAKAEGWQGFEFLLAKAAAKARLVILGQNLTTENTKTGSYASAKVGEGVRDDVKQADAETLSDAIAHQVLAPWTLYRTGSRKLTPQPCWDSTPPTDLGAVGTAWKTAGDAVLAWQTAGGDVDVELAAMRVQIPLRKSSGTAPKAPKKAKAADAPVDQRKTFIAGQGYVDDVVEKSTKRAVTAIDPILSVVLTAIDAASKADDPYADLRKRLLASFPEFDEMKLRELVHGATMLGLASGTWSVRPK
jgi:phage gp29-like protein